MSLQQIETGLKGHPYQIYKFIEQENEENIFPLGIEICDNFPKLKPYAVRGRISELVKREVLVKLNGEDKTPARYKTSSKFKVFENNPRHMLVRCPNRNCHKVFKPRKFIPVY